MTIFAFFYVTEVSRGSKQFLSFPNFISICQAIVDLDSLYSGCFLKNNIKFIVQGFFLI